eukprot:CAMPEP_0172530278 /NCGR_PEP_ID=MMETSP1067-20121228/4058_1 /TAXON_ID=265564 ORGANISM="Thalassiosira punctigera, Strain Tpunct2005C2" /NCGR_SAMPLE_ID=MMETSP1067 /ASSEMBLY_ACC=CAM_ASM_000444 /LENGTH=63 /DNA_ID=CAMNT_0013314447 /DNA_START=519 /DNA_END=707 /DNA_ORIENTATION=+
MTFMSSFHVHGFRLTYAAPHERQNVSPFPPRAAPQAAQGGGGPLGGAPLLLVENAEPMSTAVK